MTIPHRVESPGPNILEPTLGPGLVHAAITIGELIEAGNGKVSAWS